MTIEGNETGASGRVPETAHPDASSDPVGAPPAEPRVGWPKLLTYVFLAALAVRVLYLSQYADSPFFKVPALDSLYHDLHARAIVEGQIPSQAFFRAPLYAYFLAGVYKLFGPSYWAARLVQALIGSASCVLLALLGQRVFDRRVGLLAGALMALYGPLVFFDGELHSPVLEVFLTLGFLLLAVRAGEGSRMGDWAAAGLVLGLAAITRPNALVGIPVALLWVLARPWSPAIRLRSGALFLAAALLVPGLVTLRNYRVSGDPVFIAAQGGINLYLGNRPEANGFTPSTPKRYQYAGEYEDSVALYGQRAAEEAAGRKLSASEAQRYWVRRTLDWWRSDPIAALRLGWKKLVLAWSRQEVRNNHAFDFVRSEFAPLLWLAPVGFWLAGPLGLLGMVLAWRSSPAARFLTAFTWVYVASFVLFFVADRFRLPVVPVLLLFSAHSLLTLIGSRQQSGVSDQPSAVRHQPRHPGSLRNTQHAIRTALLAVALALFVNVDWYRTATPATRALDFFSAGSRYAKLQQYPEAEAAYQQALKLDPGSAETWLNLGVAQYYQARLTEAVATFGRAIQLDPGNASAHFNLGMAKLQLDRRDEAERHLEQALQLDPTHAGARRELETIRAGR